MKTYNVCWSGGIDSTFIVTQLSQFPVSVRLFYIKGQTYRMSEPQELEAIRTIYNILCSDSRTKANLKSIEVIEKDDEIIKDREIINVHRKIYIRLLEKYKEENGGRLPPAGSQQIYADGAFISPQYIACASLAKNLGEPIELGFLQDDFESIPEFRNFATEDSFDETTKRHILKLSVNTPDKNFYKLFKDFRFPIAGQRMYKKDVWKWFVNNKYENIREKTNFCQAPIILNDGDIEPCGMCTACIGVIREGVIEPFTKDGLARYRDYVQNHDKEPERFRLKGF